MLTKCKLNNKSMRVHRQDQLYQCLMIDLCNMGVISEAQCEAAIGGAIPNGLLQTKLVDVEKEEKEEE